MSRRLQLGNYRTIPVVVLVVLVVVKAVAWCWSRRTGSRCHSVHQRVDQALRFLGTAVHEVPKAGSMARYCVAVHQCGIVEEHPFV